MLVPGTNVWNVTAAGEFHQVGLKHLSSSLICCVCQAGLFPWSSCCFACTQELFLTFSRSLQISNSYIFWIYFCILSHRKKKKKPSHQMTLIPPSSLHPAQPYPLFGAMEDILPWVPLPLSTSFLFLWAGRELGG